MPEFKTNTQGATTAGIRFAAPKIETASFEERIAPMVGQFAQGAAQGFATGSAEALVGADEEGVSAIVANAFAEFRALEKDVTNNDPGEIAWVRDKAIQDTLNTQARIQASVDQGIMSTTAANAHMQALRKEKLANPIVAMFQQDFDRALQSLTGQGARGSYFGKTQAEQNEEKRQTALNDAKVQKEIAINGLVDSGQAINKEVAGQLYNTQVMRQQRVKDLTARKDLELLGEGEAVELYEEQSLTSQAQLSQAVVNFVDGQGTAEEKVALDETFAKSYQEEAYRIKTSGMTPPAQDKARERLDASYASAKTAADDSTFVKQLQAATLEVQTKLQNKGLNTLVNAFPAMPELEMAYMLSGGNPTALAPLLEVLTDNNSLAAQFKKATDPMLKLMDQLKGGTTTATLDAIGGLMGDGKEGSPESNAIAGYIMTQKGMPTLMSQGWAKNPEAVLKKLSKTDNIHLQTISRSNEYKGIIQKQPDLAYAIVSRAAKGVMSLQVGSGRSIPQRISVSPAALNHFEQFTAPRKGETRWNIDTGGVEVSNTDKEQYVSAYRMGAANPEVWEGKHASIDEWINATFTVSTPGAEPVAKVEPPKIEAGDQAFRDAIAKEEFTPEQRAKVADVLGDSSVGRLFSGKLFEGDAKPTIYRGQAAVSEVEKREGPLSDMEKYIVKEEGFSTGSYKDTKQVDTSGVGQTGEFQGQPFKEVVKTKLARAKTLIPALDTYPPEVQNALVASVFRGSLSGSSDTLELLNAGKYKEAAKEFLRNDEYIKSKKDGDGVWKRMERVSKAISSLDSSE